MEHRHQVLLIYNGAAGKRRVAQELESILTGLTRLVHGHRLPGDGGLARHSCWRHTPAGSTRWSAAGGDGTLHYTVNDVMNAPRPLPVGYLPFGSTNDFAASAGLRRPLEENCAAIAAMAPRPPIWAGSMSGTSAMWPPSACSRRCRTRRRRPPKTCWATLPTCWRGCCGWIFPRAGGPPFRWTTGRWRGNSGYCSVSICYIGAWRCRSRTRCSWRDDGLFEVMILKPQTLPQARRLVTCLMSQEPDGELLYLLQARRRCSTSPPAGRWTAKPAPRCARRTSRAGALLGGAAGIKIQKNAESRWLFRLLWPQMGQAGRMWAKKVKSLRGLVFFLRIVCAPGK